MARTPSRTTFRASRTDGFEIITAPTVHPVARLLGLLIRLRAEITTLVAIVVAFSLLSAWLRHGFEETPARAFALAVFAVLVATVLAVPVLRRFVAHRAAAVLTRHRLRQVLVERRCLN